MPSSSPDAPFGFLNVDKPLGLTSHDVVSRVRRVFGLKKVGHAGTLDPLATGVLIVCVGGVTRLSEYVMHQTKTYRAHITLGAQTTTYDAEGEQTPVADPSHLTQHQVEAVLPRFTGDIQQVPPIYSAIKKGGKKLYEMARAGEDVQPEPRAVTIHALHIVQWGNPEFVLDITCGSGTYIRSLAHDIGQTLGVGGYLSGLVRTSSGAFRIDEAVDLETLQDSDDPHQYLVPPRKALSGFPAVNLTSAQVEEVSHGRTPGPTDAPDETLAFAYAPAGDFVAILRASRGNWRPHKVFLTS